MEYANTAEVPSQIGDLTAYKPGKSIAQVKEACDPPCISKLASNENRLGHSDVVGPVVVMVLPDTKRAKEFDQGMLENGVILWRTAAFGLPNCIRITIETNEEMVHFEESCRIVYDRLFANKKMKKVQPYAS